MAIPMIYQNSRDAQAAAQENGMTDNESAEPMPDQEQGEQATPQEQAQYDDIVTGGIWTPVIFHGPPPAPAMDELDSFVVGETLRTMRRRTVRVGE